MTWVILKRINKLISTKTWGKVLEHPGKAPFQERLRGTRDEEQRLLFRRLIPSVAILRMISIPPRRPDGSSPRYGMFGRV